MGVLFSVIIPTYNGEKTIGKLLNRLCILGTTHYSIEIIIIDSSSTDNTSQIVESYQRKTPFIKFVKIKKKDFNHGGTRNLGVKMAKGKYVCFFSQDAVPTAKSDFFKYFLEDFSISKRVVAVFGKQVPHLDTPFIQKIEQAKIFNELEKYASRGLVIQDIDLPFVKFSADTMLAWYGLFNPFACYKKSFLNKNPFSLVVYGEDLIMGKEIIEQKLVKIYDSRCKVIHSHKYNIFEYYKRQKNDLFLKLKYVNFSSNYSIFSWKLHAIFSSNEKIYRKIYYVGILFIYYLIKFIILLEFKLQKMFFKSLLVNGN
ncbi:MAG: glycosyltransferase family 2 protein [Candidatus Levybacteria bacterium]|nr:glycosyltransferase family 2 protein [Candidatus Levybacteria bacterium]